MPQLGGRELKRFSTSWPLHTSVVFYRLDIHSYYNGLLYSYGYKEKAVPDNIKEIIAMAEKAVTAIPEMKAVKASALGNTYY